MIPQYSNKDDSRGFYGTRMTKVIFFDMCETRQTTKHQGSKHHSTNNKRAKTIAILSMFSQFKILDIQKCQQTSNNKPMIKQFKHLKRDVSYLSTLYYPILISYYEDQHLESTKFITFALIPQLSRPKPDTRICDHDRHANIKSKPDINKNQLNF